MANSIPTRALRAVPDEGRSSRRAASRAQRTLDSDESYSAIADDAYPELPRLASPAEPEKPKQPKKKRARWATVLLVLGIAWLTAGVGMLGWVLWELYGTNIGVQDEYNRQIKDLEEQWANDPTPLPAPEESTEPGGEETGGGGGGVPSGTFAILYIPALNLKVPILNDTSNWSLARGVGWFPETQMVGEIGNFAIAGHHSSHGQPFDNLQRLQEGDIVEVWVGNQTYVYRMINSPANLTVDFQESWVLLPDPLNKSVDATRRLMTLVTCKEVFATPNRSVGFAEFVEIRERT